jgi:hypothetical protein
MPHFTFEPSEGVKFLITTEQTTNFPHIATTSFDQYGFTIYHRILDLHVYIRNSHNTSNRDRFNGPVKFYDYVHHHYTHGLIGPSLESIMHAAKHIPSVGLLYWYVLSPPKHRV